LTATIRYYIYLTILESASNLVEGQYGSMSSKLIYGVFNTPSNSIPGSAVCAFALQVSLSAIELFSEMEN